MKEIKGVENVKLIEQDELIEEEEIKINDNFNVNIADVGLKEDNISDLLIEEEIVEKKVEEEKQEEIIEKIEEDSMESVKVEYISVYDELKITKIEEEFLSKFAAYKLKELELHPRLFDLTSEYPDSYFEYYSEYLTLYFFGNKPYNEIRDVFEILTYELPFTLNELDNFGEKSFYVNLDENFQDGVVRLVLLYKNRTFGLKLKKEVYDHVKGKLDGLK